MNCQTCFNETKTTDENPQIKLIFTSINDSFRTLNNPRETQQFDPEQPYLKITQQKKSVNPTLAQSNIYFITADGVVGSQKNTTNEDIMIGRCNSVEKDSQQIYPNDIVLPITDLAISRLHCKIITRQGFQKNGKIQVQQYFIEFLKLQKQQKYKLPHQILRLIWLFAQPPREFYIQDIGSVFGTYLRISCKNPHEMEEGQIYLLGVENQLNILECVKNTEQLNNHTFTKEIIDRLISNQIIFNNIHGLVQTELEELKDLLIGQIGKTQQFDKCLQRRPYLQIDFENLNQNKSVQSKHIFFADLVEKNLSLIEQPITVFKIGRAEDNNIRIQNNTISRKQSRFWFSLEKQKWLICDGSVNRESSNGSWISLLNLNTKEKRLESPTKVLENGMDIKISESILKFEMFNMEKFKPKVKEPSISLKFLQLL